MTRWLLVRHGSTVWGEEHRYLGHTDEGLSQRGQWQADRLGGRMRDEPIDAYFCSDLRRAIQTLETIASMRRQGTAQPTTLRCPELREVHFGQWEGRTFAQMAPEPAALAALRGEVPFPGGEALGQLAERVDRFLINLKRRGAERPGETALLVAHGGSLRVLLCHLLGLPPAEHWRFQVDPGSLTELAWDVETGARLVSLNDRGHLVDDQTTLSPLCRGTPGGCPGVGQAPTHSALGRPQGPPLQVFPHRPPDRIQDGEANR